MLQHNPRHVSSSTLLIFRRTVLLQPLVSSLSVNGRTVYRHTVRPFTESDDTRGCNNTVLLKMSKVLLETCRGLCC